MKSKKPNKTRDTFFKTSMIKQDLSGMIKLQKDLLNGKISKEQELELLRNQQIRYSSPKDTPVEIPSHNDHSCKCVRCRLGEEAYQQHLTESMQKFGWYAHLVNPDDTVATGANYHTHGLPETLGHPDLQITFPMNGDTAHMLMINTVELIKKGTVIFADDNTQYADICGNGYKVKFVKRQEQGRPVYRMIIPNAAHGYEGGDFTKQYL